MSIKKSRDLASGFLIHYILQLTNGRFLIVKYYNLNNFLNFKSLSNELIVA
ncbi:MAG: hypothetical protein UR85_C0001G0035 [Candidatus Nomurabacteria bacterium GW2011_GWF2_35_66]|uniref:Uncharacterized protein n=1 Tax=Candidatus Nomurabacteria bacterium GW2011_GWE1_35_16 TaxID=1618761 RepID=A0A0G0DUP3_9BACT|nr:MAG: hypothetical protein UR55_C0003G0040 [Candidatus Nomurabacteria bacterium GW2011_GWF1_34_20]KKP63548.1 MAG: hypothetical protein UR57_C0003G0035 [Candidatus Nomurabacteria bacterium GW2011_GWE2_34_25]KKP66740.1 MAG: hypothetical protein UR64_C0003G0033 [Candidatus Nomurabacteria bacterium GW2011_GWE1_35_16]KKP83840.1 MAG: hypothetical protein UR85_C0001G0035 [Candidatus Nomurabacteria bacterium GW2011_GWF2_35_66]